VLHVITDLETGGAEMMLLKLLSAHRRTEPAVISLIGTGATIGGRIAALGIPVAALGLRRSATSVLRLGRLLGSARRFRPDLVQGWMYHGNLAASAIRAFTRGPLPVLWNIRQTLYRLSDEPPLTRAVVRLGSAISGRPMSILYNSTLSAVQHEALGYDRTKRVVIPNGFDCDEFHPSAEAGRELRAELGLSPGAVLVGLVARYHPMKGHEVFLRAARLLADEWPEARFVLAGRGVTRGQPALATLIEELRLGDRVALLGERTDIPRLAAALNIACSSSVRSEGFSNAIGEAMACGVPCVATDIGESGALLGDTGMLVPPADPSGLARGIGLLLAETAEQRRDRGLAARARIQRDFSLAEIARRYDELYRARVAFARETSRL
jgi:glycosyltransferase involved in cell wall biosynthesis